MPVWLAGALALMGPAIARRLTPLVRRRIGQGALVGAGVAAGNIGIPGVDLFPGGGGGLLEEAPRRRRRRRALTASDRADIAFIESILGKSAGKSFAMIIATRT